MAFNQIENPINPMSKDFKWKAMWAYLGSILEGSSCPRCTGGEFCETSDAASFYWERDVIGPYTGDAADDDFIVLETRILGALEKHAGVKKSQSSEDAEEKHEGAKKSRSSKDADQKRTERSARAKLRAKERRAARAVLLE